jgi:arylsulfatase A-like enzyme
MIRLSLLTFFLMMLLFPAGAQDNKRPNVLFIFVDDLRPEIGIYDNKIIKTPHLDRLGRKSVVFLNHYAQVPTCGASRFSLLTGIFPRNRAQLRNDAIERFVSSKEEGDTPETFIHQLRRNGYYTVGIGKISHSADGLLYPYTGDPKGAKRELPHSWDELLFNSGKWGTGWNSFFGYADGSNRQSMRGEVKPYEKGNVDDDGYVDALSAAVAADKLKQLAQSTKPFFLGVGFFKPHLPFTAPARYWDLYDPTRIPISPSPALPSDVNAASFHNSTEFNSYKLGDERPSLSHAISPDYARKLTHAYYASVSYVDAQIGKVLDALEQSGVADNTIVVVWGDHGWHLGDQRVWGKHTLSEVALRSPLIIKVPGMKDPGRKTSAIVSSVDIYPTLMELCGLQMPYTTDGKSFADVFKHADIKSEARHAYSYFNNGITVRTEQYRLTRYFRDEEPVIELYDHKNDPHENHNVASVNREVVKRLLVVLERGNTGLYNVKP